MWNSNRIKEIHLLKLKIRIEQQWIKYCEGMKEIGSL